MARGASRNVEKLATPLQILRPRLSSALTECLESCIASLSLTLAGTDGPPVLQRTREVI